MTDLSYHKMFNRIAKDYPRFKATIYINELWCNASEQISANRLYTLYNAAQPPCLENDELGFNYPCMYSTICYTPELPIPICDQKTLNQLRKEVRILHDKLQTARYNNDLAQIEDIMDKLESISLYQKHYLTSHKRIRYLSNIDHTHSLLIYRSVQSFYNTLINKEPKLVQYLKDHVVIGVKCYWSETPIHRKDNSMNK